MVRLTLTGTILILAVSASTSACSSSCAANSEKLAALRRGMTYGEATGVMGCAGTQVTSNGPESAEVSSVEWNGPRQWVVTRTQLDFRDGRLLSYTTSNRGGW